MSVWLFAARHVVGDGVDVVVGVVAVAQILNVAGAGVLHARHAVIEVIGAGVGDAVAVGEAGHRAERLMRDRRSRGSRPLWTGGLSVIARDLARAVAGVGNVPAANWHR